METNPSSSSESGQTPDQNPQGQTPNQTPQGQTPTGSQKTPIAELPQDIQDYIRDLRKQNEEARKKSEAEAKAKQETERKALAEQGKYKDLAEQHEARVKELEPVAERYSQLADLVGQQIKTQIRDWPAEVKTFDPGEDAPIEQRLAWLEKSKPLIEKLQQQARATQPGNAPNPRPSQQPADGNSYYDKLRASGKYGA